MKFLESCLVSPPRNMHAIIFHVDIFSHVSSRSLQWSGPYNGLVVPYNGLVLTIVWSFLTMVWSFLTMVWSFLTMVWSLQWSGRSLQWCLNMQQFFHIFAKHLQNMRRAMARANHPDKNPHPQARSAFIAGQAAYERLVSGAAGSQGPQVLRIVIEPGLHKISCICRVGQNHIYSPYMTVYLVIFCRKYRTYTVYIWLWPTLCIQVK